MTSGEALPNSTPGVPVTETTSRIRDKMETIQGVLLSIQMITITDCPFDFMVERAGALLDEGLTLSNDMHQTITFSISLRDVNETVAQREHQSDCFGETFQFGSRNPMGCHRPTFIITKIPCPEYELEFAELKSLQPGTTATLMSHFFDTQNKLNENTVVNVCVDKYDEIMTIKMVQAVFRRKLSIFPPFLSCIYIKQFSEGHYCYYVTNLADIVKLHHLAL